MEFYVNSGVGHWMSGGGCQGLVTLGFGRGALDWEGAWHGANGACPVVKQKRGNTGLLIDGRVVTADGANKEPLGASKGLATGGACWGLLWFTVSCQC